VVSERQPTASASARQAEPVAKRAIDDVDSLRAMADPTRMQILYTLMTPQHGELPVMSAKELAAALGESQTKLYRHIRQLEAVGLIHVAATRMVSGIQEQRYQAGQWDFTLGGSFLREHADESELMMRVIMDAFRDEYFGAFRAAKRPAEEVPADLMFRRPKLFHASATVSEAKAAEIRGRLDEFLNWLSDNVKEEKQGVRISLLAGYYTDAEQD
jgi:DNA-binding transcriptional ArsR family regulator